jgi:Tfp pilus assembly protein PilN
MRPVNLIPADERRGGHGPMRTGAISYVIVGALAVGLLCMVALAITSKKVSDREAEVGKLETELADATARADSMSAFASFRAMQQSRTATVTALAQSRFDWQRVLNELALVIPTDVWLVEVAGTVSPAVNVEDAPDISIRDSAPGPALEMVGCAVGQDAVARFVADLEDVDGVTRVGVSTSMRPEDEQSDASAGVVASDSSSESSGECRTRDFISRFELVVAFDEVPEPPSATTAPGVPAPVAPGGTDGGQLAQAQQGTENATNLLPGG